MARADLQRALDEALHDRMKLEFAALFDGMFAGQGSKATAVEKFKRGVSDHLEAHAEASRVIAEIVSG